MDLLFLVLIFSAIGYFLGTSNFGRKADWTTEKAALTSKRLADRMEDRWKAFLEPGLFARQFVRFVENAPEGQFPPESLDWLLKLDDHDLQRFVKSLVDYSNGLGFNLSQLIKGGLDHDPRLKQIFVEAITVYSSAYRKAKQVHKPLADEPDETEVLEAKKETVSTDNAGEGKKSGQPQKVAEVASTD